MFAWIAENAATIAAAAIVLFAAGIAVFSIVREKKKKCGGCTGNCMSCGKCCSCCREESAREEVDSWPEV